MGAETCDKYDRSDRRAVLSGASVAFVANVAPPRGLFVSRLLELAERSDAWDQDRAVERIKATLARVEVLSADCSHAQRATFRNLLADCGARLGALCLRRDSAALDRTLSDLESVVRGLR
jgi:hypothetical protein